MIRNGTSNISVPGKIIICGEFATGFGYSGLAIPSRETMRVCHVPKRDVGLTVMWTNDALQPAWAMYAGQIAECIGRFTGCDVRGEMTIETDLPLGKGMGSSTALVIAVARTLLGDDCREIALRVEDEMNPGHSGMDFAVIWENHAVLFKKDTVPERPNLPEDFLSSAELIDSGVPSETTPELVAWVKSRAKELEEPLQTIGRCTQRILAGEDMKTVIRDHHRAQVKLGVVPRAARNIIEDIEACGGAAKIIGAGGRTGGGGMVLALPS